MAPAWIERLDLDTALQMLSALPFFAVIVDRERYWVWVNRVDPTLTLEQLKGTRVEDFVADDYRELAVATIERSFETGEVGYYEALAFSEGAMQTWYGVTVVPFVRDEGGEPLAMLLSADVTEERLARELREQLLQAQKMELMGQLAGGVAHDFNNLLTVILNNAAIARAKVTGDSEAAEHLEYIELASQRAAELTRQLLAFSRKQPRRTAAICAAELVDEALAMVERVLPETVVVHPPPERVAATLHVDRAQIEQVLMNLCVNARDAMPVGGSLSLRTRLARLEPDDPRAGGGGGGDYLEIAVTDTGAGMAPSVAARIFEPFFTTKAVDQGTGLGLSVALGIVEAHGGAIDVATAPDTGTTVSVFLPVTVAEVTAAPLPEPAATAAPPACRVLIVDDDARVRHSLRLLLEHEGYEVVEAASGEEAIEIARGDAGLDAAVLDVVMPGLGGPETCERLLELREGLPVVFSTGYGHSRLSSEFLRGHGAEVIAKPYRLETLAAAIERARGGRGRRN